MTAIHAKGAVGGVAIPPRKPKNSTLQKVKKHLRRPRRQKANKKPKQPESTSEPKGYKNPKQHETAA